MESANKIYFRCCNYCHSVAIKKCGRCNIKYCNTTCQTNDWPAHRTECNNQVDYDPMLKYITQNKHIIENLSAIYKTYDREIQIEITDYDLESNTNLVNLCDGALSSNLENRGEIITVRHGKEIKCNKLTTKSQDTMIIYVHRRADVLSESKIPVYYHGKMIAFINPIEHHKSMVPIICRNETIKIALVGNDFCGIIVPI